MFLVPTLPRRAFVFAMRDRNRPNKDGTGIFVSGVTSNDFPRAMLPYRSAADFLLTRTLGHVLCRLRSYLHDGLRLFVECVQLLTHKFGLNFPNLFHILSLTKLLYKCDSRGNVFRGIAE